MRIRYKKNLLFVAYCGFDNGQQASEKRT
jgi:hypothetical protein